MHLRKLELKDAPLMLSWMQDKNVTENLKADFSSKTLLDAEHFITEYRDSESGLHLAIVSEEDEYMGTVSLKNIRNGIAEFAIVVRAEAMGQGFSWFGMKSILEKAFQELYLKTVYWCVSEQNMRAVRFYDKHGFHETAEVPREILGRYEGMEDLKWYSVSNCGDHRKHSDKIGRQL